MKVSAIKKNPNNPRILRDEKFKKLCKSIKDFPQMMELRPIVVDEGGVILGGNMRFEALKANGLKEIPDAWVKRASELTEEQKREFIVKDNVGFGDWDWDALANEWDSGKLTEWGLDLPDYQEVALEAKEEDEEQVAETISKAKELQEKWQTAPGQLWKLGEHRLLCADSTRADSYARCLDGQKVTMMFTDPPWNVAIGKDSNPRHRQREGLHNDDLDPAEFTHFLNSFASQAFKVVEGDVYCVLGASEWPTLDLTLRSCGFHWSATIIWVKDQFVLGRSKYHRRYEPIWYGWSKKGKSSFQERRDLDDVWEVPRPRVSEEHPTMKPIELCIRAIENSSKRGDSVLEPFCGSGSTLLAAEQLGRRCFGIELSPDYCAVILERWADYTGKTPELIDG